MATTLEQRQVLYRYLLAQFDNTERDRQRSKFIGILLSLISHMSDKEIDNWVGWLSQVKVGTNA
jgi:hypothetical protein